MALIILGSKRTRQGVTVDKTHPHHIRIQVQTDAGVNIYRQVAAEANMRGKWAMPAICFFMGNRDEFIAMIPKHPLATAVEPPVKVWKQLTT